MEGPKEIYCPKCKGKVKTWSGIGSIIITTKCKKCKKLVVYDPVEKRTYMKEIPGRKKSSGVRFY